MLWHDEQDASGNCCNLVRSMDTNGNSDGIGSPVPVVAAAAEAATEAGTDCDSDVLEEGI